MQADRIPPWQDRLAKWWAESPRTMFLAPSVLIILFLSIFPLVTSVYLSLCRIKFVPGGFEITYIGLKNYEKLITGSEERHFLGKYSELTTLGWIVLAVSIVFMLYLLVNYCLREKLRPLALITAAAFTYAAKELLPSVVYILRESGMTFNSIRQFMREEYGWSSGGADLRLAAFVIGLAAAIWLIRRTQASGVIFRIISIMFATELIWIMLRTMSEGGFNEDGLLGTLGVTLVFVFGGVFFQYVFGLGLALLVTQNLPGKRFFRVIFLLPMMITPVGIGFLFRMLTDTILGPLSPIWKAVGLGEISWADTPFGARSAVMVGDIWQWTPFMFIILLAALEGVQTEQVEAALVDGANGWQVFRFIVIPQILPVSTTLVLIRLIEAFKIIDLPNILTRGGPGTATESMSLHAFSLWRALDLGTSAAIAYLLLILVTFIALAYVNFLRRRLLERL